MWRIAGAQGRGEGTGASLLGSAGAFATFVLFRDGSGRGLVERLGTSPGAGQIWFIDEWTVRSGSAGPRTLFLERGELHLPEGWNSHGIRGFDLGVPPAPGRYPARGGFGAHPFHARVIRLGPDP